MLRIFDDASQTQTCGYRLLRFPRPSSQDQGGNGGAMHNNRVKSKSADRFAGLDEPARLRAALERLIDIHSRCSADVERVLREAQELRRKLIDEARSSHRDAKV